MVVVAAWYNRAGLLPPEIESKMVYLLGFKRADIAVGDNDFQGLRLDTSNLWWLKPSNETFILAGGWVPVLPPSDSFTISYVWLPEIMTKLFFIIRVK